MTSTLMTSIAALSCGRLTHIIAVLLHSKPLTPTMEERMAAINLGCSNRQVAVFLNTSELAVFSLGGQIEAISNQYYLDASLAVADLANVLNPNTEMTMLTRYHCKRAFLFELRQDLKEALQLYRAAYKMLLAMRKNVERSWEVKVVAGLVCAKICFCLFALHQPKDALKEALEHISTFRVLELAAGTKATTRSSETFKHEGWLAQQYFYLASLFADSTKLKYFDTLSTQHPGFYYRHAAYHTGLRRQYAQRTRGDARLVTITVSDDAIHALLKHQ